MWLPGDGDTDPADPPEPVRSAVDVIRSVYRFFVKCAVKVKSAERLASRCTPDVVRQLDCPLTPSDALPQRAKQYPVPAVAE